MKIKEKKIRKRYKINANVVIIEALSSPNNKIMKIDEYQMNWMAWTRKMFRKKIKTFVHTTDETMRLDKNNPKISMHVLILTLSD